MGVGTRNLSNPSFYLYILLCHQIKLGRHYLFKELNCSYQEPSILEFWKWEILINVGHLLKSIQKPGGRTAADDKIMLVLRRQAIFHLFVIWLIHVLNIWINITYCFWKWEVTFRNQHKICFYLFIFIFISVLIVLLRI